MKHAAQAILILASAAVLALLSGCTADGAFDANGFNSAMNTGLHVYQETQRPAPVYVGMDANGQPIYR